VVGPKPLGRPSTVKSGDPLTSLRVDEWPLEARGKRVARKRKADPSPPFATTFAPLTADKRNWVPFGCAQGRRDDTHQEKQKDDGRRLQVRAESQQTAIAILHHELPRVPGHVAKPPSEFHALGCVLGIKCVGIFNEEVGSFAQGL
jgi:hypothetical protein